MVIEHLRILKAGGSIELQAMFEKAFDRIDLNFHWKNNFIKLFNNF